MCGAQFPSFLISRARSGFLRIGAFALACCSLLVNAASAQTETPVGDTSQTLPRLKPGLHLLEKGDATDDVKIRQDLPQALLEDVLERFRLQQQAELFDLQKIDITGAVDGDLIRLTADILVSVDVSEEWVRVPLGMSGLNVTKLTHESDAADARGRFEKTALPKKNWLLYGAGEHRIQMQLIDRIRTDASGKQRLRLEVAQATQAHLLLRLPYMGGSVDVTGELPFHVRTGNDDDSSEIETWGISEDTEISWFPQLTSTGKGVSVQVSEAANMILDLTNASLEIRQPIVVTDGAVTSVTVNLPDGFEVGAVRAIDVEDRNVAKSSAENGGSSLTIDFSVPVSDRVVLEYDLRLPVESYPQEISLSIPDLVDVTGETADIEMFVPRGLEVDVAEPANSSIRQKRVESVSRDRTPGVAYELLAEDARLFVTVRETEAFYSVASLVSLEAERNAVVLTGRFTVNVRGSLAEMEIAWPGHVADGWTIHDVRMQKAGSVTDSPVGRALSPDNRDNLRVSFGSRQSGQFEIQLEAVRDIESFQQAGLISLPDILSPTPHTTTVALVESDAFSMALRPEAGDTPFPVLPVTRLPDDLRQRDSLAGAYLVDAQDESVELSITPQRPEVRTDLVAALSIVDNTIHVSEVIEFDVLHRDLTEISLNVPDVDAVVRVDGLEDPLESQDAVPGRRTYTLPDSRRGRFRVLVDFYWQPSRTSGIEQALSETIPLVTLDAEQKPRHVTVTTATPNSLVVNGGDRWTRIYHDQYPAAWRTGSETVSIPVALRHRLVRTHDAALRLTIIRSVVCGPTLLTAMTSIYDRPRSAVLYSTGPRTRVKDGFMGNVQADIDQVANAEGGTTYQLRAPTGSRTDALTTTIVFEQPLNTTSGFLSVSDSQIPEVVGHDRRENVIWILRDLTGAAIVHSGLALTDLTHGISGRGRTSSPGVRDAIDMILEPYDAQTRSAAKTILQQSPGDGEVASVLAGRMKTGHHRFYVVPFRTMLLAMAVLSLVVYAFIVRLKFLSLVTVAVGLIVTFLLCLSLLPASFTPVVYALLPAVVAASVAGLLQRWLAAGSRPRKRPAQNADQTTVFVMERSVDVPGTRTDTAQTAIVS